MSYPVAKGHMLKVWAKAVCPLCGDDLSHVGDDIDEGDFHDTYACNYCRILVTYVSPCKYTEYHTVPDDQKRYIMEHQL